MVSRLCLVVIILILRVSVAAVQQRPAAVEVVGDAVEPQPVAATPEQRAQLETPPGFEASLFASDLGNSRMPAAGTYQHRK
jgi:hypothetical protein